MEKKDQQDDLSVVSLGPAERDAPYVATVQNTRPSTVKSSSSMGTKLIMVTLLCAVSGLGYHNWTLEERIARQLPIQKQLESQLAETMQSLSISDSSAEQSGKTLAGRLEALQNDMEQRHKHFDSEIAKLWTVSYQSNKPRIEQQSESLKAAEAEQQKQQKLLNDLKTQLASLSSAQQAAGKKVSELSALSERIVTQDKKVAEQSKLISELKQQQVDAVESNSKLKTGIEQQKADLANLIERLQKIETAAASDLSLRVSLNEEAIQAFDSTRRDINQDMLNIKQRLNNLQLQLEQQKKAR